MSGIEETPRDAAALLAENQQLRDEVAKLREFVDNLSALSTALERVKEDADLHLLLNQVLRMVGDAVRARDASLLVMDEDTDELVFVISRGSLDTNALAWRRIPAGQGVAGWVAHNRRATIVNHAQSDDRFYSAIDTEHQFRTESILAAPIIGGARVLGVIEVLNKTDGRLFSAQDQALLSLA